MIDRIWLKTVIETARLTLLTAGDDRHSADMVDIAHKLNAAGIRPPRSEAERLLLLGIETDVAHKVAAARHRLDGTPFGTVTWFLRRHSRDSSLTRARVARAIGLSESWLAHGLKNATGRSFAEHLEHARLTDAEQLLRHSTYSVKQIALTVGLRSESALARLFRRRHNTTPTLWRHRACRVQGATDA